MIFIVIVDMVVNCNKKNEYKSAREVCHRYSQNMALRYWCIIKKFNFFENFRGFN